ncbi:MAG: hypothetical protein ABW194_01310 [Novosphingobium sp.]
MAPRALLAAAALVLSGLAASPAAAKSDAARMAERLGDARTQATVSAAVRALSAAMLDLRVAPLLNAAEAFRDPYRPRTVDPDLTLGDLAGPGAEAVPEDLSRRLPAMMGAIGGMAGTVEAMTPALEGMAREMGRAMGEAMHHARRDVDAVDDADIPSAREE